MVHPTLLLFAFLCLCFTAFGWESALYPVDSWQPGVKDNDGRFLHDFSYAGYHRGEIPLPSAPYPGLNVDITAAPYNADPTGEADSTAAIQAALDHVGQNGGGTVFMPAGTFKIQAAPADTNQLVTIRYPNVVLKGAGADQTFVLIADTFMRSKIGISVIPDGGGSWHANAVDIVPLSGDILSVTKDIPVEDASNYAVSDWIVIKADLTAELIAFYGMTGKWTASLQGPTHYRQVTEINGNTLTIDIPTRNTFLLRDNARVYKVKPSVEEVGIEDFSIGGLENPKTGYEANDYNVQGTGAYDVHASKVIRFNHAVNCWLRRVKTYKPAANAQYHMVSNGVEIQKARSITVEDCSFDLPQYRGGGGNGYSFTLVGSDSLITGCTALAARHAYDFKSFWTTGNVVHNSASKDPSLASDFHMHMSCCNLFDNMTMDGDYLEAAYRPYGTVEHGWPTSESVFWNTYGIKSRAGRDYIVQSSQFGHGYVIGTRGIVTAASYPITTQGQDSSPEDFVEGLGTSTELEPQSLWSHQLQRRVVAPTSSSSSSSSSGQTGSTTQAPAISLVNDMTLLNNSAVRSDHSIENLWDGCLLAEPDCSTGTSDTNSFWVSFDFGEVYHLSSARLYGDSVGTWVCMTWSLSVKVELTAEWEPVITSVDCNSNEWSERALGGVQAKYARVEIVGGTAVQAAELEIYGLIPTSSSSSSLSPSASSSSSEVEDFLSQGAPTMKLSMAPMGLLALMALVAFGFQ